MKDNTIKWDATQSTVTGSLGVSDERAQVIVEALNADGKKDGSNMDSLVAATFAVCETPTEQALALFFIGRNAGSRSNPMNALMAMLGGAE